MIKKPELLSPVFDFISLNNAINAGCDAIYFGIKDLNMRITAKNFDINQLQKISKICHNKKVKCYLTLNTIIYENELDKVKKILEHAKKARIDAVICWDLSIIQECKKLNIPFHISTQASVSNSESAKFYKKLGATRVILARELNIEQIKEIIKKTKIEVEVFIHGALCVSISGRCFTSQFLFNKSANRGDCIQPCRRSYIVKDKKTNQEIELNNDKILSPKDLCTIEFIDELIKAGITSFKIEGRAKTPEYVKIVTEVYRKAIDAYFDKKLNNNLKKKLISKLKKVYNRDFGSGFYLGKPINQWSDSNSQATRKKRFVGVVKKYYDKIKVAEIDLQSLGIKVGDTIMINTKEGTFEQKVKSIEVKNKKIKIGKKGTKIGLKLYKKVRIKDKIFLLE